MSSIQKQENIIAELQQEVEELQEKLESSGSQFEDMTEQIEEIMADLRAADVSEGAEADEAKQEQMDKIRLLTENALK